MPAEPSIINRSAERLTWAMSFCHQAHLRLTAQRESILRYLAEHRSPMSIEMMARSEVFSRHCAATTIYRALMLFREVDLVRQINLPGKTSYFMLNLPGERFDFLVCRRCARIQELVAPAAVLRWERKVAADSGFASVYHELELFGICPTCQTACQNTERATKLACLSPPGTWPTGVAL